MDFRKVLTTVAAAWLVASLALAPAPAAGGEVSEQRFFSAFLDALRGGNDAEALRLVRENPQTAAGLQRNLGAAADQAARAGANEDAKNFRNLAAILAEFREGTSLRVRWAGLPTGERELLDALGEAFNNEDMETITRLVRENPQTARRVHGFMESNADIAGKNRAAFLQLAEDIGIILAPREPPAEPMLRLETGMHTAKINSIDVDEAGRLLATASDDKTVRLWSLPDGRLLRVLRPPVDAGNEGKVYAVAVSPDGALVAAGGFTGGWDREGHIYLFDAASGRLVRRLSGLPEVINHLAFSRDGRFLAATLGGKNGVRVWRRRDWRLVMEDADYGARSRWADFDGDGRLVTTSFDGFIRLYGRDLRRLAKVRAPGGRRPFSAAFSPDGRRVAVGYEDTTRVDVLSGRDLGFLFAPDTGGIDNGNLSTVAWSADGLVLYAGGMWQRGDTIHFRRWADGGRGAYRDLAAAQNTITDIRPLPAGGIAFAAADPAFGVFDGGGHKVLESTPVIADFRNNHAGFLVSRDASQVRFGFDYGGKRPARFSPSDRDLVLDPPADPALAAPVTATAGLAFTGWKNTAEPELNGRPLRLKRYEVSRSLAIPPGDAAFLLGTDWLLSLFGLDGNQKWWVLSPGITWGVNISGDGRVAVATFGDGTIRWYRMSDGKEILAFFPHRDGKEWVAWTPQGYYMSSPRGDNLIGWHLNNGKDEAADFHSARQFERILYRPDFVQAYFRNHGDLDRTLAEVGGDFFDINDLRSIAPPRIDIRSPAIGASVSRPRVKLKIAVGKRSLPMRDYTVFVNSIPVTPTSERTLHGGEKDTFVRELEIPLFGRDNEIRVEVFNGTSMGLAETFVHRTGKIGAAGKGDLYLLAVGANRFPGIPGADLDYAAQDAESFARLFRIKGEQQFRRVFIKTVSDNSRLKPSGKNILDALGLFSQAKARDTVILFLASHGLSDRAGNYYFTPADATQGDVNTILGGSGKAPSLLGWETFFEALRSTAGRRLLLVDTCQAKNVAGTLDFHSLAKRSASSSFALIAASKGDEESQEYPAGRHGLFTYALIGGMFGAGDRNGDGRITLDEAFRFAGPFVEANRPIRDKGQTPQMMAPAPLREMVLIRY